MDLTVFNALCNTLGSKKLKDEDKWKSIKYLSIAGQSAPGFDFQTLLKANRIYFLKNNNIGPGFVLLDSAYSDMGVTNVNDPVLSFIPLQTIDAITFVVDNNDDGTIPSIYEITKDISSDKYDIPVIIRFPNSLYYFKYGDAIKIPVIFSREITSDNYDIEYSDNLGNKLDKKPTEVGSYGLTIICKNGYTGKGFVRFEIQ